jgi:F0F1-type ATP synthase assembly protein I
MDGLTIAIKMLLSMVLGTIIGYKSDEILATVPLFTIILSIIFLCLGIYGFIRGNKKFRFK